MPMNTMLSIIISMVGDDEFLEMKSGRNAKKNIVNFGLSRFIAIAFVTICAALASVVFLLISNVPASRHIFQARYSKYIAPAIFKAEKTCALISSSADNPNILAKICGTIPSVHPMAAAMLARHLSVSPVVIV